MCKKKKLQPGTNQKSLWHSCPQNRNYCILFFTSRTNPKTHEVEKDKCKSHRSVSRIFAGFFLNKLNGRNASRVHVTVLRNVNSPNNKCTFALIDCTQSHSTSPNPLNSSSWVSLQNNSANSGGSRNGASSSAWLYSGAEEVPVPIVPLFLHPERFCKLTFTVSICNCKRVGHSA